MLKHAPDSFLNFLLQIFNHIWSSHTFPEFWKTTEVIPLLKPNKNPLLFDSYRQISLTCKLFGNIVNSRRL